MNNLPSLAAPVRLSLIATAAAQTTTGAGAYPTESAARMPLSPGLQAVTPASNVSPAAPPLNPWVATIPEAACIPTDIPQTGRVVEVVDAQTIRVLMDRDQRVYAVRYLGIEVPPTANRLLGLSGLLRNVELTYHKTATLVRDISDQDEFGRLLRHVMVDRTFVNYELVASGYASALSSSPDTACSTAFKLVEGQARSRALGIWSVPAPAP
jgi:endonuclease YncB( thermonuclease family)